MANATAITVNDLVANTGNAGPTADVLDTGTAAVTLPLNLAGKGSDRVVVRITNTAAAALKVDVLAGDNPPAMRAPLGDKELVAALAQNGVIYAGPFESSRFLHNDSGTDGRLDLTFTPASGTIGVSIVAIRLPKSA
jgi:hypothetical protein